MPVGTAVVVHTISHPFKALYIATLDNPAKMFQNSGLQLSLDARDSKVLATADLFEVVVDERLDLGLHRQAILV